MAKRRTDNTIFWPLCCLSFFDLLLLITTLVF
jgi:hypothetical protein